ncbi:MAG: CRISPR-associated CARF protein Csa3 [Candidatus Freyarchaeota archaeon]
MERASSPKILYISLGFDITGFLSSILDRHFTNGDSVVLIIPKNRSERNEEAIKQIELLLTQLQLKGLKISMETLELDEENPEESLKKLIAHIKKQNGTVYLDAVGGLRIFCVLMAIAGILIPNKKIQISSIAENMGKRIDIPKFKIKAISAVSPIRLKILKAIKDKPKKLEEIEEIFKKDKSTISRHLNTLEDNKLIQKTSLKPSEYKITPIGEIILEILAQN